MRIPESVCGAQLNFMGEVGSGGGVDDLSKGISAVSLMGGEGG